MPEDNALRDDRLALRIHVSVVLQAVIYHCYTMTGTNALIQTILICLITLYQNLLWLCRAFMIMTISEYRRRGAYIPTALMTSNRVNLFTSERQVT
jgi:hypothetical protein